MHYLDKELDNLRHRFENHMDDHRLEEGDYNERQLRQDLAHQENIEAIAKLTKAVQPLVDGVTVLVVTQKLVKWLSGFAFLGIVIAWITGINPFK